jgi:hypothetical protein
MVVIFLDFDGVITTAESISEAFSNKRNGIIIGKDWMKHQIDTNLATNVRLLQEHLGAKIVISSTWRIVDDIDTLRTWLHERGGIDPKTIIDITPHRNDGSRGREIKDWLDAHPEVTSFKILDDDSDVLDVPEFKKDWIHTSFSEGFSNRKLKQAINEKSA